ncbi:V-type ATP synthase subunit I [Halosegnis sp.]|uniref:V-type ATP synthase subunit I n=1 Tax=Halosegnis sp. TaxID=2864959 RepID=UPI0035D40C7B
MLRPERMSRVSVAGSKGVMDDVIETVHELRLFDMTDYDGEWPGFAPGDPIEGADDASSRLVTVRSLQSILGVDPDEYNGPTRVLDDGELETELAEVREEVNALDERREDLDDELRAVEEQLEAVEPFVELGIDIDLLHGYENLSVVVGEGDREAVSRALVDAEGVEAHEIFGDEVLAVAVYPGDVALDDVLVGATFTRLEVPETDSDPETYAAELRERHSELEAELESVEADLARLREEVGGFLLAAEEQLAVEVQKREAPLSFATTENAFVAEGWLPTERFVDLAEGLQDAVGDRVEIEELERADYDEHGFATGPAEDVAGGTEGGEPVAADGGHAAGAGDQPMSGGAPPVVQDNPDVVKPFEALVEIINKPKYSELDPTIVLFLTFPVFFGFMIGDLGYGLLYMAIGYLLMTRFESDVIRSLGGVGLLAGVFTAVFGVLYGEIFGLHQLGEIVWPSGSPPLHKGLSPEHADYAVGWLTLSLFAGILHLTVGWVFDFYQNISHGLEDAMTESGSWLLMMFGLWAWVFAGASGSAPDIFVDPSKAVFNGHPFPLGFAGFPDVVGTIGLAVFAVGLILLLYGEPLEGIEFLNVLVNVLSYTRLAAVLLAKAGMAFVVNLLFFGVYVTETDHGNAWHFAMGHMPKVGETVHGHEVVEIMFGGLLHGGVAAFLGGIVILVLGHALVLALGVTSAGLQAVRLEYVEFFGKFYEGGGRDYQPFGYERQFTTEE